MLDLSEDYGRKPGASSATIAKPDELRAAGGVIRRASCSLFFYWPCCLDGRLFAGIRASSQAFDHALGMGHKCVETDPNERRGLRYTELLVSYGSDDAAWPNTYRLPQGPCRRLDLP